MYRIKRQIIAGLVLLPIMLLLFWVIGCAPAPLLPCNPGFVLAENDPGVCCPFGAPFSADDGFCYENEEEADLAARTRALQDACAGFMTSEQVLASLRVILADRLAGNSYSDEVFLVQDTCGSNQDCLTCSLALVEAIYFP